MTIESIEQLQKKIRIGLGLPKPTVLAKGTVSLPKEKKDGATSK